VKHKKQITYFERGISWNNDKYYHPKFLSELSDIFPSLKTLKISIEHDKHDDYFPLNEFIKQFAKLFSKMISFINPNLVRE
jgi:hypothetical protein